MAINSLSSGELGCRKDSWDKMNQVEQGVRWKVSWVQKFVSCLGAQAVLSCILPGGMEGPLEGRPHSSGTDVTMQTPIWNPRDAQIIDLKYDGCQGPLSTTTHTICNPTSGPRERGKSYEVTGLAEPQLDTLRHTKSTRPSSLSTFTQPSSTTPPTRAIRRSVP